MGARESLLRIAYQYRELAIQATLKGWTDDAEEYSEVAEKFQTAADEMEAKWKPSLPSDPFQGFRN
jgi:hypothetical protein